MVINLLKSAKRYEKKVKDSILLNQRRITLGNNRISGKLGEHNANVEFSMKGYHLTRAPKGQDFIIQKKNPFTGRLVGPKRRLEVKTGNAKLSTLQQVTQKKKNYIVRRY